MAFLGKKKNRIRGKVQPERNFKRQFFRGFLLIFVIAFLLTVTWYVTRLQFLTITDIIIQGGETISHDDIRARVSEELQGNYFSIVPKRFVYTYPHDRIVEVLEKVPRAHGISVRMNSNTELNVSFNEFIPHALWCSYEKHDAPCYFINEEGYAFVVAPKLQGSTFVRHLVEGVDEIKQGTVIEQSKLALIDTFITRVSDEFRFRVTSVVHKKNGDIELYSNGGGMILVSSTRDFTETFENLKSVLLSPEFKHLEPGNFKYIDVRFDNKVFVNEEFETETASSTATTTLPES